jgi:adenylate kinase
MIIIAAVPGAGKTTALKFLKKKLKQVKVINVGDLIFSIARKKFKIKDRDEIREKISVKHQRLLQETAYKKIARMRTKTLLIDTHLSIKTPNGFLPGLSDQLVYLLRPDVIIILEYNPEDINKRRVEDKTRKRDVEKPEEIEEHQEFNKRFGSAAAAVAGCPLEVIKLRFKEKRKFDHARKAAEEIIKIIRRFGE